jgi:hypothetical protein
MQPIQTIQVPHCICQNSPRSFLVGKLIEPSYRSLKNVNGIVFWLHDFFLKLVYFADQTILGFWIWYFLWIDSRSASYPGN